MSDLEDLRVPSPTDEPLYLVHCQRVLTQYVKAVPQMLLKIRLLWDWTLGVLFLIKDRHGDRDLGGSREFCGV